MKKGIFVVDGSNDKEQMFFFNKWYDTIYEEQIEYLKIPVKDLSDISSKIKNLENLIKENGLENNE